MYQSWLAFRGRPTRHFVNHNFSGPSPERWSARDLMGQGKLGRGKVGLGLLTITEFNF